MPRELESEIDRKLRHIFTESLHVELPSNGTGLISGGLLDSLALVELLLQIEKEFGLTPDFEQLEIEDFETLEAIARLISGSRELGTSL